MRMLIPQADIERRVRELAAEIDRDYARRPPRDPDNAHRPPGGPNVARPPRDPNAARRSPRDPNVGRPADDPVICVGVLKGSVFFLSDLLKQVTVPVAVDFFQTSSYGSLGANRGEVRIRKDIDLSIHGRDVLLVEDIVDTGYTLRTILDLLRFRGARSVRLCALLDKAAAREIEVPIDYRGFEIENVFVVGYGLDHGERYRNLPYVAVWEP